MKDILHKISDKSDAAEIDLRYSIKQQIEEDNLMRKRKNGRLRFRLTWVAALVGILIVGVVGYGRNMQRIYHPVTLEEIEAMATPLNLAESRDDITIYVDWGYVDATGVVVAYSAVDAEGNVLTTDQLDGRVELHYMWDNVQYSGFSRDAFTHDPESTQQVTRFDFSPGYFAMLDAWEEGAGDIRNNPTLRFRMYFFPDTDSSLHASLLFDFELPNRRSIFEQHNDFIDFSAYWDSEYPVHVDETQIYFNDIIIADSSLSAFVCTHFPNDAPIGWYFPAEVNLFVDNIPVNTVPSYVLQNSENRNRYANAIEFEDYLHYKSEENRVSCGAYIWHMAFDEMPETIRIEIPALRNSYVPEEFSDEEEMQGYIDLFAEEGFIITPPESGALLIRDVHFDEAWNELDHASRYLIERRVLDEFFAQFPPEIQYNDGWEYTFEIYEMPPETPPPPAYHEVSIQEIERQSTHIGRSVTQDLLNAQDNLTMEINWAYADANQIVLAMTVYDSDGNILTGNEFPAGSLELWQVSPGVTDEDNIEFIPRWSFGREPLVSSPESGQQILRFPIAHGFMESDKAVLLGDLDLQLEATFLIETGSDLHAEYPIRFDVLFYDARYEQHNNYVDTTWRDEPATDVEVYFNDMVISDSATSLEVCIYLPESGQTAAFYPGEVNLYMDGQEITAEPELIGYDFLVNDYQVAEEDSPFSYYTARNRAQCGFYLWHIDFDVMPDQIEVEIPTIYAETDYFATEETEQVYLELADNAGLPVTSQGEMIDANDERFDLSVLEYYELSSSVREAFNEVYPPQLAYDNGWRETFYITPPVIGTVADVTPVYHDVSVTDIEALATPVDESFTQNRINSPYNFTMEIDWAYADANQIVMAVTAYDLDGNMLTGEEFPPGSVELWQVESDLVRDENIEFTQLWRFGREPLATIPVSGQQIIRFPVPSDFLESDNASLLDEGAIQLEATFLIPIITDIYEEYPIHFEVPFVDASHEQHNTGFPSPRDITSRDEPVTELEVYFNDLVISDTATSVELCIYLPDDAQATTFYAEEINLFMNDIPVTSAPESIGIDWLVNEYQVVEREFRFSPNPVNRSGQCGRYMWHIDFDVMPAVLRVEIPSIYRDISYAESDETRDTYFELMADAGHETSEIYYEDEDRIMTLLPDSWAELSRLEQNDISRSVRVAFNEIYPPQVAYDEGWSTTFYLTPPVIVPRQESYHQVFEEDVEALATPLDLVQSDDETTIELHWAYVDANQIAFSLDVYEAEKYPRPIPADESVSDIAMQMWVMYPETDGDNVEYRLLHSFGRYAIWEEDNPGEERIGQYYVSPFYFNMEEAFRDVGIDLNDLENIRFELRFYPRVSDENTPPTHVFEFDVPFSGSRYEQHNNLVDLSTFPDVPGFTSSPDEIEVMFNDLIITDSATVLNVCAQFPYGYQGIGDTVVTLYADGEEIETVQRQGMLSPTGTGEELENERLIVQQQTGTEDEHDTCIHVMWHMAFESLPQTIRIEMFSDNYSDGWDYTFNISE